jgi:hypothetical protein
MSSRPEVHFQLASATTPVQFLQQLAVAMGLPSNASNAQILSRGTGLYNTMVQIAAGQAGQPEAVVALTS